MKWPRLRVKCSWGFFLKNFQFKIICFIFAPLWQKKKQIKVSGQL